MYNIHYDYPKLNDWLKGAFMWFVSFEDWMTSLRRVAKREGVELESNDEVYRKNFERGETAIGTISLVIEFGEN